MNIKLPKIYNKSSWKRSLLIQQWNELEPHSTSCTHYIPPPGRVSRPLMGNSRRYKALTAPGQTITLPSLAATAASAAPPGLLWTVWGDDVVLLCDLECGEGESCAGFKRNRKYEGNVSSGSMKNPEVYALCWVQYKYQKSIKPIITLRPWINYFVKTQ